MNDDDDGLEPVTIEHLKTLTSEDWEAALKEWSELTMGEAEAPIVTKYVNGQVNVLNFEYYKDRKSNDI